MRFNEKDLAILAKRKGQIEGRLQYRAPPGTFRDSAFRERFFRLVNNLLFFFRISDVGTIEFKEPVGVIVLENYSVRAERDSDLSFAFGVLFLDEPDKRHTFTARSDSDANQWVNTLRQASYQHWRSRLDAMKCNIAALKEARSITPMLQRTTEELNLLELEESKPISRMSTRHNPFLSSPKPPPRNHHLSSSSSSINSISSRSTNTNNNNEGNSDLIKF